jgi:hypothetical protein
MNNNQLQLVTYKQAVALRHAGFDWPTSWYYNETGHIYNSGFVRQHNGGAFPVVSAPTVALALKWMRDVKDMGKCSVFYQPSGGLWAIDGYRIDRRTMENRFSDLHNTYESAESLLLDELLKTIEK